MVSTVTPHEYRRNVEQLRELIKDVKIAMLSTFDSEGHIRSRPMGTQQVEMDNDLWFFTASDSEKAAEVQQNPQVNLSYASPEDNRYISVSGKGELVRDADKMEELWNPIFKIWFPDGLDDPKLILLKVTIEEAEYWEYPAGAGGVVKMAIGFVQDLVAGDKEKDKADTGENEKLKFT